MARRTAEEIGHTELGPRELPPLGEQRIALAPSSVDTVLPNGLRVIALRAASVPMVELRLHIPFGGEDPHHPATAEVLAETLLTGTATRDRVAVDTDLALVGGQLSTVVDPEALHIGGGSLADGMPRLLDVLADALTSACYRDGEVTRERARLVERLAVARAQPGVIAREALQRQRYGDHPYAREVPEAEDVATVTPEQVRALHAASVVPRGATMVLVGSIDPESTVSAVEQALAGWHSDTAATSMLALPPVAGGELRLVHREGAVQSQLRLSAQAVARTDPRYPALQLANLAYGGYFSSRLVENIREDKGYTYHAHSGFEFNRDGATVLIDTDTATDVTAAALLEVRHELAKLAIVPPDATETDTVRNYAVGILAIMTASQSGLASQLIALASVGLGVDWLAEHPARLQAVTAEQVAEAARVFYNPAAYTGVVVGDGDVIGESLRVLGGVALP